MKLAEQAPRTGAPRLLTRIVLWAMPSSMLRSAIESMDGPLPPTAQRVRDLLSKEYERRQKARAARATAG